MPESKRPEPSKRQKYMVWPFDDLLAICTEQDLKHLDTLTDRLVRRREELGKPTAKSYAVVDLSKPYAAEVVDILKKHGHWD